MEMEQQQEQKNAQSEQQMKSEKTPSTSLQKSEQEKRSLERSTATISSIAQNIAEFGLETYAKKLSIKNNVSTRENFYCNLGAENKDIYSEALFFILNEFVSKSGLPNAPSESVVYSWVEPLLEGYMTYSLDDFVLAIANYRRGKYPSVKLYGVISLDKIQEIMAEYDNERWDYLVEENKYQKQEVEELTEDEKAKADRFVAEAQKARLEEERLNRLDPKPQRLFYQQATEYFELIVQLLKDGREITLDPQNISDLYYFIDSRGLVKLNNQEKIEMYNEMIKEFSEPREARYNCRRKCVIDFIAELPEEGIDKFFFEVEKSRLEFIDEKLQEHGIVYKGIFKKEKTFNKLKNRRAR